MSNQMLFLSEKKLNFLLKDFDVAILLITLYKDSTIRHLQFFIKFYCFYIQCKPFHLSQYTIEERNIINKLRSFFGEELQLDQHPIIDEDKFEKLSKLYFLCRLILQSNNLLTNGQDIVPDRTRIFSDDSGIRRMVSRKRNRRDS